MTKLPFEELNFYFGLSPTERYPSLSLRASQSKLFSLSYINPFFLSIVCSVNSERERDGDEEAMVDEQVEERDMEIPRKEENSDTEVVSGRCAVQDYDLSTSPNIMGESDPTQTSSCEVESQESPDNAILNPITPTDPIQVDNK
ncbi:hypothetical protein RJ641_016431 [Dillenia turbinata]|uniref:Uncharacterized protein n=1 Tax=Dillenia turbinata TaxID=194707 RepID=A0AAN8UPJ0_9MAGN